MKGKIIFPDGFLVYFNTIRLVRAALQEKNNEIKNYKRKCSEYQDKLSERENRLTRMEESRRKNDEEFLDLKKENDKMLVRCFIGRTFGKSFLDPEFLRMNENYVKRKCFYRILTEFNMRALSLTLIMARRI